MCIFSVNIARVKPEELSWGESLEVMIILSVSLSLSLVLRQIIWQLSLNKRASLCSGTFTGITALSSEDAASAWVKVNLFQHWGQLLRAHFVCKCAMVSFSLSFTLPASLPPSLSPSHTYRSSLHSAALSAFKVQSLDFLNMKHWAEEKAAILSRVILRTSVFYHCHWLFSYCFSGGTWTQRLLQSIHLCVRETARKRGRGSNNTIMPHIRDAEDSGLFLSFLQHEHGHQGLSLPLNKS